MKKALLYFFWFVLVQFFLSWVVYAVWLMATGSTAAEVLHVFGGGNANAITAPMLITASAVSSAAVIALFVWRKYSVVSPVYLRTRPWSVFFWCAIVALGTLIPSMWLQELLPDMPDMTGDTFKMIMGNDYGYFVLCLLAPFVEEMVFRGAVLRALLGSFSRHWIAILISAVVFALVHANPVQMPHAFLIGLLLGWMYYRTRSILPGVIVHWVNNTVAYAAYILMPQTADMKLIDLFGGNHNSVVLSIVFSLFILLPGIYQLNSNMKPADR